MPPQEKDLFVIRRLRFEQTIRQIETKIHASDAPDYFHALVRGLALCLDVQYAFVTEFLPAAWRVRTLGLWLHDHFGKNTTYSLNDTPCAKVMKGAACYFPTSIQELFPRDLGLQQMKAQSYLGVPVKNAGGEVLGHLVIMDTRVMHDKPFLLSVLTHFAEEVTKLLECQLSSE